jgi:hypothetical protein
MWKAAYEQPTTAYAMSDNKEAAQPGDAERLERIRKNYEVKPVAGFDGEVGERFLLRMIDARDIEIARLRAELEAIRARYGLLHQKLSDAQSARSAADAELEAVKAIYYACIRQLSGGSY